MTALELFYNNIKDKIKGDEDLLGDIIFIFSIAKQKERSQQREILMEFKEWEANKCKLPWDVNIDEIIKRYLAIEQCCEPITGKELRI